jgi:hypothetical protein
MSKAKDAMSPETRSFRKALNKLSLAIRLEMYERMRRVAETPALSPLERAGIWRSLHSYMDNEIRRVDPDWTEVKRLHTAWVASQVWMKSEDAKTARPSHE